METTKSILIFVGRHVAAAIITTTVAYYTREALVRHTAEQAKKSQ